MTKTHETTRTIDGVRCRCQDTGCDDFERAEFNRYIIKNKLFITAYIIAEMEAAQTPPSKSIVTWEPIDWLPQVGRHAQRQYGGERGGEDEVNEPIVVGLDKG